MNGEQIWQAAQEELRFQLSKPSYETWLKNASLVGREKNAFKIGVPTKLAKDWLEDRYSAMIKETLSAIVSGDVSVWSGLDEFTLVAIPMFVMKSGFSSSS